MEAQKQFFDKPAMRAMRRRDRAEDDAWIGSFLLRAPGGVLAVADSGGPILNANLFVFEPATHSIWMHTAGNGHLRNLLETPKACSFSAFELGRMVSADRAMNFSCEYASVIALGTCVLESDPKRASNMLQLFMDKYAPHRRVGLDYEAATSADLKLTAVYCMSVTSWSGKRKKLPADEPGTYEFSATREFPRAVGSADGHGWKSEIVRAIGAESAIWTK